MNGKKVLNVTTSNIIREAIFIKKRFDFFIKLLISQLLIFQFFLGLKVKN